MTKKICPNCKTENPDSAGFCLECGTTLKTDSNVKSNAVENGFGNWWNQQGNGAKVLVIASVCCIGLLIIVAIAGMISPDKTTANTTQSNTTSTTTTPTTAPTTTTTNSSTSSSTSGVQIKVSGSGTWSGSYGDTSGQQSVDGSGTKTFDMGSPDIVSGVFQKKNDGSGTLTVEIIENGNVVETKSTSAEYGVVSVSHSFI